MKIYIHIWHDSKTHEDFMHEQKFATTINEAIEQYHQEDYGDFSYKRTMRLDTDTKEFNNIDIEDIIENRKTEEEDDYEKLTGHEMGLIKGGI